MIPHVNDSKRDFAEEELAFAVEKTKKIQWYHRVLLNRPLRVFVALTIVAVVTPILIYNYIFFPSLDLPPSDGFSFGSCLVPRESRIPCGLGTESADQCHSQCCYDYNNSLCFHRFPSRFSYLLRTNWTEEVFLIPRTLITPFASQRSYTNIRLSIDEVSPTHLSITLYHSDESITGRRIEEKNYEYNVIEPELNIIVKSKQGIIFNLARGPFIASDNMWEISFRLTDEAMFGLGEIPLKDTVKIIHNHRGGMSSIPLIYAKLNGTYHGLLIDNVTPTEVIIRSDNQVVVRSITTWGLKFHLFVGPKPVDVMKDVMAAMQVKRKLEYWMLGAHVCSEATSEDPLTEIQTFLNTTNTQSLPFDSHCGTAPVVFDTECNATQVTLVNQGATLLGTAGKKFMPHVSPYIRYKIPEEESTTEVETTTEGEFIPVYDEITTETKPNPEQCLDAEQYKLHFIHNSESTDFYQGMVDDYEVIYPSYENISKELMQNLWVYNTNFAGVVLENNWPLDESKKDIEEAKKNLPYFNKDFEAVFNHTPQWNARLPVLNQLDSKHTLLSNTTQTIGEKYLYTHNKYGNRFATEFEKIKGPIPILTSSQWMNGNVVINRQDIPTSWASLHKELIEASLGGISGHWYWSSPICGDTEHFNRTIQDKLCAKWYMAGTFMPMVKIHSRINLRDPLTFAGIDRAYMITALTRRMSLLPYFYSVLQEGPLLRPMFYQFPLSDDLKHLTSQFAVGDDLLIVPNLLPSQTHVHVWLPPGSWYDFWDGSKIIGQEGEVVTMSTTEADFFTMIRGGSILVMQKNTQLTAELTRRESVYTLIIALHCKNNTDENIEQTTTVQSTITEKVSTTTEILITEEVIPTTETLITEEVNTTTETSITEEVITTTETSITEATTETLITEEVNPTTETTITEEVNPTTETSITEEVDPTTETEEITEEVDPTTETLITEEVNPTTETSITEEVNTTTETEEITEEVDPTTETLITEEVNPTTETLITEEVNPTTETSITEEVNPTTETTITEEVNPTTETSITEEVDPTTETEEITEEVDPTTETLITEEVNPTTETSITEEVNTTTETEEITEEVDPTTETLITEEVNPTTETLITEEVNPTTETSITEEVNPTTETTITEEVNPTTETSITEEVNTTTETSITEEVDPTTETLITEEVNPTTETSITEEVNTTTETSITEEVNPTTETSITEEVNPTTETSITEEVNTTTETSITEEVNPTTETSITEEVNTTTETEEDDTSTKTTIIEEHSTIGTPDQANKDIETKTLVNNVCEATGKFYINENMAITFKANSKSISITATGNNFQDICDPNEALWSNTIREIIIYGLDEDQNNFDNYRNVTTTIDLCQLQTQNEIVFQFVD